LKGCSKEDLSQRWWLGPGCKEILVDRVEFRKERKILIDSGDVEVLGSRIERDLKDNGSF
jgi:hypothetical protein